ncbi:AMP-binding enzyme, partial [Microbispora triticiradicis]|uniref:AMP-binding enzyme n=1 Tax=Microbispora triticiradicis TaxID=2200763 RepID=UPI001AD7724D
PLPPDQKRLSIGRAHQGADLMLIGESGDPINTPGVVGELYLRSAALFSGYWDDPEATARALVPDPLNPRSGQPVFRTGDLAYLGESGELYFCGRADSQVKIRGNRVELGEVERRILEFPGIAGAAATMLPRPEGDPVLAAFVVLEPGAPALEHRNLEAFCLATLPDYMAPQRIVQLRELPLTPNGKVDRLALAAQHG